MDKQSVKITMLSLEEDALKAARETYLAYVADARLDRSEPIESDEQAQAEIASDLSEAFDQPIHTHEEKIQKLKTIDFGPKSEVSEGAIVNINGCYFVIAVSTARFNCEGTELMGISTAAPIYAAMEGKRPGETCTFNGRSLVLEEVH